MALHTAQRTTAHLAALLIYCSQILFYLRYVQDGSHLVCV